MKKKRVSVPERGADENMKTKMMRAVRSNVPSLAPHDGRNAGFVRLESQML